MGRHDSHLINMHECDEKAYAVAIQRVQKSSKEPISFLQAPLYGLVQSNTQKRVIYFVIKSDETIIGCGLAVRYTAPGGLQFLYCPYGPVGINCSENVLYELRNFFQPIAKREGCVFARIEVENVKGFAKVRRVPDKLARTASLQPRAEWLLNISPDEDTLWMGFHKHARYNVRLAERANAITEVYKPTEAPLETFYSLMQTTGGRDGFGIFNKTYYESYLQSLTDEEGFMVIVTIDGKPAAAGLFVVFDGQAHYVFAGSSDDFRKIAPAYMVIWTAMKEAKRRGCTRFNFGGVTDTVKGQDLGGVTGFKKRFGGFQVDHANPVDLVYKPLSYALFKLYKSLR